VPTARRGRRRRRRRRGSVCRCLPPGHTHISMQSPHREGGGYSLISAAHHPNAMAVDSCGLRSYRVQVSSEREALGDRFGLLCSCAVVCVSE